MGEFHYEKLIVDGVHHDHLPSDYYYDLGSQSIAVAEDTGVNLNTILTTIRQPWGLDLRERVLRGRTITLNWRFGETTAPMCQCLHDQLQTLFSLQRAFYVQFDNMTSRTAGRLFTDDHTGYFYTSDYPIVKRGRTPYADGDSYSIAYDGPPLAPPVSLLSVDEKTGVVEVEHPPTAHTGYVLSMNYAVRHFCVIESLALRAIPNTFEDGGGLDYYYVGSVTLREVNEPDASYYQEPWPVYCGSISKYEDTDDDDNEEIFPPPVEGYHRKCYAITQAHNTPSLPNGDLYSKIDFTYSPLADLPDGIFLRKIEEKFTLNIDSPYLDKDAVYTVSHNRMYADLTPVSGSVNGQQFSSTYKATKLPGYAGTAATAYNYALPQKIDFRFFTALKLRTMTPTAIMSPGVMFDWIKAELTTDIWEANTGSGSPDFFFGRSPKTPWILSGRTYEDVTYYDTTLKEEKWQVRFSGVLVMSAFTNGGVGYIQKADYLMRTARPAYSLLTPPVSGGGGGGGGVRQNPSSSTEINASTTVLVGLKFEWINPSKPIPDEIELQPSVKYAPRQILVAASTAYNRPTGNSLELMTVKTEAGNIEISVRREWTNTAPGVPTDPYTFNAYTLQEIKINGVVTTWASSHELQLASKTVKLNRSGVGYYPTSVSYSSSRTGESVQPLVDDATGNGEETISFLLKDTHGTLIPDIDYKVCIEYQKLKPVPLSATILDMKAGASYTNVPEYTGDPATIIQTPSKDGAYSFATSIGARLSGYADSVNEAPTLDDTDYITGLRVSFSARYIDEVLETATLTVVFDIGGSQYVVGTASITDAAWNHFSVGGYYDDNVMNVINTAASLDNLRIYFLVNTPSVHSGNVVEVSDIGVIAFAADEVV